VRDFRQFSHFVVSKSTFSEGFFLGTSKFATSKPMFRARPPSIFSQNATPATEFAPCRHLTQPSHAICKKHPTRHVQSAASATKNDDGHVQSAAPGTKTATHLLKTSQKYCACHTKRLSTRYRTRLNVTKCHAYHAKRSNETLETSKNDPSCRTYHRHGHTLTRTVADGCERLRDANTTSSEHTLHPQTPRVKREPLLCIREKCIGTSLCHE